MAEQTEQGTPLPQPGEWWALQYPGYPRVPRRIERLAGDTAIGLVERAERYPTGYDPRQQIRLSHRDAYRPRKIAEAKEGA